MWGIVIAIHTNLGIGSWRSSLGCMLLQMLLLVVFCLAKWAHHSCPYRTGVNRICFISITKSQLGDKLLAASFIISAAANLSVTLLIATKMWWTSKKIRQIFTMQFSDMCDYVVCLILDSNAIYSLSIVLYLGFHTLVIDASLTQIAAVTLAAMILRKSSADSLANTSTYSSSTSIPQISPAMQRTRSVTRRRNRFRMAFSSNPFKRGSEGIEAK
ncbi:hypothetical protein CPC08DRAFT_419917 [Agrocybe pediades]|nr:hypothetical protein CPC08DRAFT_419917 [Agrocybe pediades]